MKHTSLLSRYKKEIKASEHQQTYDQMFNSTVHAQHVTKPGSGKKHFNTVTTCILDQTLIIICTLSILLICNQFII
jgi:hypothetical protein